SMAMPQALEYSASCVGLSVSSAATDSQPTARSDAGVVPDGPGWLGSAAMSVGSVDDSLPVANTTSPSLSWMKARYSSAIGSVSLASFQYKPPHELFMIRAPLSIRSWWIGSRPSPSEPSTSLPSPEPSSSGGSSEMIRAETISAPGAMPPGHAPNAVPAAICDTAVPCPTTSSTSRLLVLGSRYAKLAATRGYSAGWARLTPLSTTPMRTPSPVNPASCAELLLVSSRCLLNAGSGSYTTGGPGVAGGGSTGRTTFEWPPPPPPQAASITSPA